MATDVTVTPAIEHLPAQIPEKPGNFKCLETQELAELFKLKESLSNDELVTVAVQEYDGAVYGIARAGAALLIIKTRVDWGKFAPTLSERGISSQRASEMMRVAERLSQLPADEAKRIAAMRPTVVIALARFTAQELLWASNTGKVSVLAKMKGPEIVEWRRQRRLGGAHDAAKQRDEVTEAAELRATREPRTLIVGRDEFLSEVQRLHLGIDRAKEILQAALPNETDRFKLERLEVAHAAHQILQAAALQLRDLNETLLSRFGALVTKPADGEYRTLPYSAIVASHDRALTQAEADQAERAKTRAAAYKWRGAPPKTLKAAIAQALEADKADHE